MDISLKAQAGEEVRVSGYGGTPGDLLAGMVGRRGGMVEVAVHRGSHRFGSWCRLNRNPKLTI